MCLQCETRRHFSKVVDNNHICIQTEFQKIALYWFGDYVVTIKKETVYDILCYIEI